MSKVYRQVDKNADPFAVDDDLEAFVKERYMNRQEEAEDLDRYPETEALEATEVEQQALLPSRTRDPFLWLVKVRRGQEKDVMVRIMRKAIYFEQQKRKNGKGPVLQICSVMHHANLKGYIYVEAKKDIHVKKAVEGLQDVYHSKEAVVVPHKEMPNAINPAKNVTVELKEQAWVRIRGGVYKKDIARVLTVNTDGTRVVVKVVPRIDYMALKKKVESEKNKGRSAESDNSGARKVRVAAKAFNVEDARKFLFQVETKRHQIFGDLFEFNGKQYKDGYELKNMSIRGLIPNVKPTYDELFQFNNAKVNTNQFDGEDDEKVVTQTFQDAAALEDAAGEEMSNAKACAKFARGDTVLVVKGDLKNLVGTVKRILEKERIVVIKPDHEELTDLLEIDALQLEKYFTVGKHVKVVRGQHEGSTGMVVNVDDSTGIASVFSDVTQEHIKVFTRDLEDCAAIANGLTRFGENYQLLDMVQLGDMSVGVIVGVDRDACKVLTNLSVTSKQEVRTCKAKDLQRKIHASKLTGLDVFNNIVNSGDAIKILQGDWKGKQGVVKHVAKHNYLFVECRDVLTNLGIICVKAKSCQVVGGESGGAGGFASRMGSRQGPSGARSSGPRSFGERQRRSPLVGKLVMIKKGPHKRFRGKVLDVGDSTVKVELEGQCKVVTVKFSQLGAAERNVLTGGFLGPKGGAGLFNHPATVPNMQSGRHGPFGPASGSKTPMHAGVYGAPTPMHAGFGSQTPMHAGFGSQTPMHAGFGGSGMPFRGSQTPSRDRASNPFRVNVEERPDYRSMPAVSKTKQKNASEVDPQWLMDVVLYCRSLKKYGKVINIMPSRVTLQLGTFDADLGFKSTAPTDDFDLKDLEVVKPPDRAIVRVIDQVVDHPDLSLGAEGNMIGDGNVGEALVRFRGVEIEDLGDVKNIKLTSLAYVIV